jgi:hypothetical protein
MGLRVEADAGAPGGPGADDWAVESNESMLDALEEDPALFGEGPPNLLLARAELGRLRDGEAAAAFRAAAEAFETIGLPVPVTYARFREGEALVAAGDRAGAAVPLRAAHSLATIGPPQREIEALALRARVNLPPPRRPSRPTTRTIPPQGSASLARAAGAPARGRGRTNREIGAELFMSEKTASVHVSRILGCSTSRVASRPPPSPTAGLTGAS